jgi:hypothetical protein
LANPLRRKSKIQESAGLTDEQASILTNNYQFLEESFRELEASIAEQGWLRAGSGSQVEFSRPVLHDLIQLARVMAIKNPLIRRAVNVQSNYVFGQGCQISADDDEVGAVLDDFLTDKGNQSELTSHGAMTLNEMALQHDGNLIFTLFADPINGTTRVRSIIIDQITEIICNPEDAQERWFYKREWDREVIDPATGQKSSRRMIAYYADMHLPNNPPKRSGWGISWPDSIGGMPVHFDPRICHVKVGHLKHQKFGVPDFYSAIDWARAYKEFLEGETSIWKALQRFAWKITGSKTPKGLAALKEKLNTTRTSSTSETNPPKIAGSTVALRDGQDMTPMPKSGASINPADGKYLALMVSSGTDIPHTMLTGDPDQGNLATAKTLDRPTELAMRDRQELWKAVFKQIAMFVVENAVQAGVLDGRIETNAYGSKRLVLTGKDPDSGEDRSANVDVVFPPILEHDQKAVVDSIVSAAPFLSKRLVAELLMTGLGVQDVETKLEEWEDELPDVAPDSPQAEALRNVIEAAKAFRESIDKEAA